MGEETRSESALAMALFGPFDVQIEGRPLPRLRSQKTRWLLALLALQKGRAVDRAWLAAMLWPDSGETQAAFNLRRNLTDLRQSLGPEARRLEAPTTQTLRLDLVGAEADVLVFDEAIARGDAPSLERAIALHRGPLLADCEEEWILPERQAREQEYLAALERLAAEATAEGDHPAAIGHLRRAVAVGPFRESAQRALLQALAAGGEYPSVLLAYREYRGLLHRELNAEPDPETTALFRRLREAARGKTALGSRLSALGEGGRPSDGDTTSSSPNREQRAESREHAPATHLPQPLSSFVGREQEIEKIIARLSTVRLLTLTGAGGVGKTRLAIRIAEEVADETPDGVCFVDLAPLSDPALVPQTVARVLGVREEPGRTLMTTLQEVLRPKQLLLVLDNCEHLIDACARLAEAVLWDAPRLRILATSRQALGLTGETAWRVPSLFLPPSSQQWRERLTPVGEDLVSVLMQFEAVRLFVNRGSEAAPGFTLTERNWQATVEACLQLEGIPLAIELAAARLKALTVEQLAARLEDRLRLLTWGSRTALPRHQTLRATLDWSYDLLTEAERTLLRRLSVFAGGFTLEAAEAVCGDDALDLLTSLVDKSLVLLEQREEAEPRYRLLETIRQYAQECLREAQEEGVFRRRHRDWFLDLAERSEPELQGPHQREWLDRLEGEHANLRAALAWTSGVAKASAGPPDDPGDADEHLDAGLRLGAALGGFWRLRNYWAEGRERLGALLMISARSTAPGVSLTGQARALHAAGVLAWLQGDYGAARSHLAEGLAIQRELRDRPAIAESLNILGLVAHGEGDCATARPLLQESLTLQREQGNTWGYATALCNLGRIARVQGEYTTARRHFAESLALFRELGDQRGVAVTLDNLGLVHREQGEHAAARACHEESLTIQRELGDRYAAACALGNLGIVAREQGGYRVAQTLFEESLAIRRALGDQWGTGAMLNNLGLVAHDLGEYTVARSLHEESLAIRRALGDQSGIGSSLSNLGLVFHSPGEYGAARAVLEESLTVRHTIGDRLGVVLSLECLSELTLAQGQPERAARLFGATAALREALGAPVVPNERAEYERLVATLRTALGEEGFAGVWAEGWTMSLEQAIECALTGCREQIPAEVG